VRAVDDHDALEGAFELIGQNPRIGGTRPEIDGRTRSLVNRSHTIYYEIMPEFVFILRVLHGLIPAWKPTPHPR
jgi:plasmid stabilization system protein ParE